MVGNDAYCSADFTATTIYVGKNFIPTFSASQPCIFFLRFLKSKWVVYNLHIISTNEDASDQVKLIFK